MLGVGHSATSTSGDRSAFRQSWSSDEPTSSNASVSSKERKGLWSKLRKQASRMHASQSVQTELAMPHRGSISSTTSAPGTMRPHTMTADARRASACVGPTAVTASVSAGTQYEQVKQAGLERLKMIAAMGSADSSEPQANGLAMQPRRAAPPPPPMVATQSESGVRGSADLRRRLAPTANEPLMRGSVDMYRRPGTAHAGASESLMRGSVDMYRRPGTAQAGANERLARGSVDVYRKPAPALAAINESADMHQRAGPTTANEPLMRGSVDMYRRPGPAQTGVNEALMRGSVDMHRRAGHSYSVDIPRAADHSNPSDISADSIRRTLGAYTGKTETKGKPRLRRLMLRPPGSREQPADAGLECIAEDDEQPMHVHGIEDSAAKRFSENSGSTACSSDTLDVEAQRAGARRQRLSAFGGSRPKAVFYEDGVVGLPDVHRSPARPASSLHRMESLVSRQGSLVSRQGSLTARQRLSRCASDETLDATAGRARSDNADARAGEAERLRRTVRQLEARNDMLGELLARDPLDGVPEGVRVHMRTLELENAWLRRELARQASV
ncbi:hypothetical protein IWW50_005972 [Coemansia erecta]|nr:hypothetical protein IWW50_005972 [Coemansia erecta]